MVFFRDFLRTIKDGTDATDHLAKSAKPLQSKSLFVAEALISMYV
jgi:hypothetical protein